MIVTPLSMIQSWAKLSTMILVKEPGFTFTYRMFINREEHPCWRCGLWNNPIGNCVWRTIRYNYKRVDWRNKDIVVIYPEKCEWIKSELYKVTFPQHKIEQVVSYEELEFVLNSNISDEEKKEDNTDDGTSYSIEPEQISPQAYPLSKQLLRKLKIETEENFFGKIDAHFITEKLRSILISARVRLKLTHKEGAIFDLAFEYPYLFEYFFTPKGNLPKDMSGLFNEFTIQLYFKDNKSLINAIQRLKAKFREVIHIDKDRQLPIWQRIEVKREILDWGDDRRYSPSYPRIMRAFEYTKEKKDYSPIYVRS